MKIKMSGFISRKLAVASSRGSRPLPSHPLGPGSSTARVAGQQTIVYSTISIYLHFYSINFFLSISSSFPLPPLLLPAPLSAHDHGRLRPQICVALEASLPPGNAFAPELAIILSGRPWLWRKYK